jgi:hypothetical protein
MDGFHFPTQQRPDAVSIYYDRGFNTAGTSGWSQLWTKPKWASMVYMFCLGSGASGAGGNSRASLGAAVSAGGGGGGCSGFSKLAIPAAFLPERLFVRVGPARAGGAAGAPGLAGINSIIAVTENGVANTSFILQSNANPPAAPAAATTTGAAGAVGTVGVIANSIFGHTGAWSSVVSVAGTAGGVNASAGPSVTPLGTSVFTGGAGGGGSSAGANNLTAGGAISAVSGLLPVRLGGLAGGGDGERGFFSLNPLFGTGGSGGGSNPTGTGGNGGHGAYGCGGGGGGQGVTGGRGGNSGGGLVIIVCA